MILRVHPYLHPTAPIASQAILTDDPKAAMDLAAALCDSPRMSNLAHGLWGYGGTTPGGLAITVQSLGIGGPSAFAVVSELAALGVRRAVRIGPCLAIDPSLEPGSVIVPTEILSHDGVGRTLCKDGATITPDLAMAEELLALTGGRRGSVCSFDLVDRGREGLSAQASDLSSAAVIATASSVGVACACALVVFESASGERLAPDAMEKELLAVGILAGEALGARCQLPGV